MAKTQPILDKWACDPDVWFSSARFTCAASQTLFQDDNVLVWFAAANLGHHALEMFLKTALICEGMVICNPRHAEAFGIDRDDCAWGHDLIKLARLLTAKRTDFDLSAEIDIRGYFIHKMPMSIEQGLALFQPYFDELRYPHEMELMEGIGQHEVIVLNALAATIQPFICVRSERTDGFIWSVQGASRT